MSAPIEGKVLFVVNTRNANWQPIVNQVVNTLLADDYNGVSLKVCHGQWFNGRNTPADVDLLAEKLEGTGIDFHGWHWNLLDDVDSEVAIALEAIKRWKLKSYALDFEAPVLDKPSKQVEFARKLSEATDIPIGLSSYRYVDGHPEIKWEDVCAYIDFHAPQVYWVGKHNPAAQLQESYNQLIAVRELPFIPIGSAYTQASYNWEPTEADLNEFDKKAHDMGLPGVQWFAFRSAKPIDGYLPGGLLPILAKHHWEVEEPEPSEPDCDKLIEEAVKPLQDRIAELEAENAQLKAALDEGFDGAYKQGNNDALNNLIKPYLL